MQIIPNERFNNTPCSMVAMYYAYKDIYNQRIAVNEIIRTRSDGYLALSKMNTYINMFFKIKKTEQYAKDKRFTLAEFLINGNEKKCIVCLEGHYIYVKGKDYFSFFNNLHDKIVKIWYVEERKDV